MTLRATHATKNPMLNALGDLLNSAVLEIRTGTQPAAASAAPTGTLLWSETLPADAFAVAASGQMVKNGTWSATPTASGTAGWFRLKLASDTGAVSETELRLDGLVTLPGNGGEMTLNPLALAVGVAAEVLTCTVSL